MFCAHEVTYLGILTNARLGTLCVGEDRVAKLLGLLRHIRQGCRLDKQSLQKAAGALLWVANVLPEGKPGLLTSTDP